MGYNRVFFPQAALDDWIADDRVEFTEGELVIKAEGRRYHLTESVRVLSEVTGAEDRYNLVGKVKERATVEANGGELFETSLILGENAYEIVPGWLGLPIGSFTAHMTGRERRRALAESEARPVLGVQPEQPTRDEDLLAGFLMRNLE